ncbi:hypothetical protein PlfCFBP13513_19035 [Plantibacter flavus]|uniref:hypothetical protein n=1 Tax=Plantibacter TaxID=190323 RepID=UPI0010C1FEAA|nr:MULTISPECIES: hypothetical protein [Plantibacter]MBD8104621.1 hypothetical protein [Plantibacter sp. CFBP 8775]MBD8535133.1 hypothetical protein [Plantibacter sp. CFBP 13570]TKJ95879.1 hypothetical protein PlfCFBP13513_19035 [Plantibacter flavus]
MSGRWCLIAIRRAAIAHDGLRRDAEALAAEGCLVELVFAGDALSEFLASCADEPIATTASPYERLVDRHSLRRRGSPELPRDVIVVDEYHVADRLLDPAWRVVWR